MQQSSFDNIFSLVQDCYVENRNMKNVVEEYFEETKVMYHEAMHTSVVQNSLIAPKVKGLEQEAIASPPQDLEYEIRIYL
jgi:hypothetical protein